jgi:hypothetical protein
MKRVKIAGQRGSWFATAEDQKLPIMWADEIHRENGKLALRTDWLESPRKETASKRAELVNFFENALSKETKIIVAQAKDTSVHPREIKHYVCIYKVIVCQTTPEIELQIIEKIAEAKF